MEFKQAFMRLQEINQLLKSDELIDVSEIIELQQEAKYLYDFCNKELEKIPSKDDLLISKQNE